MTIALLLLLVGILGCATQDVGQGDGPFQGELDLRTVAVRRATSLTAGDFNGDGIPDLAVGTDAGDKTLIWFGKRS